MCKKHSSLKKISMPLLGLEMPPLGAKSVKYPVWNPHYKVSDIQKLFSCHWLPRYLENMPLYWISRLVCWWHVFAFDNKFFALDNTLFMLLLRITHWLCKISRFGVGQHFFLLDTTFLLLIARFLRCIT